MTQNLNRSKIKTWGSAVTGGTNFAVKQDNFYVAFPGQRQDRRWVHEADSVHRRLRALHDLSRQPRVGIVGASPFPFLFFFKGPACRTYWLVWFQMATRWKPVSKAGVAVVDFFFGLCEYDRAHSRLIKTQQSFDSADYTLMKNMIINIVYANGRPKASRRGTFTVGETTWKLCDCLLSVFCSRLANGFLCVYILSCHILLRGLSMINGFWVKIAVHPHRWETLARHLVTDCIRSWRLISVWTREKEPFSSEAARHRTRRLLENSRDDGTDESICAT